MPRQKIKVGNIYTDASIQAAFPSYLPTVGLACYFADHSHLSTTRCFESSKFTSTRAEISAIKLALRVLEGHPTLYDEVHIWVDCWAAIEVADQILYEHIDPGYHSGLFPLQQSLRVLSRHNVRVEFCKVKAHSGVPGNEIADYLAFCAAMNEEYAGSGLPFRTSITELEAKFGAR